MGDALELQHNYVIAATHWRKSSDPVRQGMANLKHAVRILDGKEDFWAGIDGEITPEQEASTYFGHAEICFKEAGFASLEEFVTGLAASAREREGCREADSLLESLVAYFHCQRSPFSRNDSYWNNLYIATLLDQVELRNQIGDPERVIEVLEHLYYFAGAIKNRGLESLAKQELDAIRSTRARGE